MNTELVGLYRTELEDFMEKMGEKRFRGRQIHRWIYQNFASSFQEMTDLPRSLRERLQGIASLSLPTVLKENISKDGTRKLLLRLNDHRTIEMVIIPSLSAGAGRYTACVSSQAGCPLGCRFCATGMGGFERNLAAFEIVGQVLLACKFLKAASENAVLAPGPGLTNVVFMGMGEPFLNYPAVMRALKLITSNDGLNIGQRHVTVSTAGVVEGIRKLAEEGLQVTLAVSLHAARDELRDVLVPLNRRYPLAELQAALKDYIQKTGRRVTLEYILLDKVNTSRRDAQLLAKFARPLLVNINLIPYNQVSGTEYRRPPGAVINQFRHWLLGAGLNVALREERGGDVAAACGQLRMQNAETSGRKIPFPGRKPIC